MEGPEGECEIEQFWQAGAPVAMLDAMTYRIGSQAIMTLDPGAEIRSESGWRSKAYGRREPAPVVIARCKRNYRCDSSVNSASHRDRPRRIPAFNLLGSPSPNRTHRYGHITRILILHLVVNQLSVGCR